MNCGQIAISPTKGTDEFRPATYSRSRVVPKERNLSAWTLSRRFHLAPPPAAGTPNEDDRLELAWDGHRLLACRAGDDVRLFSTDFREWTKSFPGITNAIRKLATVRDVVLDGFVCALDEQGHPSFDALRAYVAKPKGGRIVFAVCDVVLKNDADLSPRPLSERMAALTEVLAGARDPLVRSEALEGAADAILESLATMNVRGIVARSLDGNYSAAATCVPTREPIVWERSLSAAPAVTNADKVLFPRDGITKADIAAYYDDVAPLMLAVMRDRPVVCQRWPDGIDDFTWFQHRLPPRAPDYIRSVATDSAPRGKVARDQWRDRRILIETREALGWMVNQAALTYHGWSSRASSLEEPDWVILDLDPGEKTKWGTVIDVALAIRKLLEMLELPSVVKTSGKKGLHVLVPIAPGHNATQTHELALGIASLVARLYPNEVSLDAQDEPRQGRLYLDFLQNFSGKTLVLPYSLRAVDGAPASTPIAWSEVTHSLDPHAFTLRTLRGRLDRVGDLAGPLLCGTVKLGPALAKLKG